MKKNNYEEFESDDSNVEYFNKVFQKKLLTYIANISVSEYTKNIIPNIKKSLDLLTRVTDDTLPKDIRTLKIQNFEDISKKKNITLSTFERLIENTPALIPLLICI